MVDLLLENAWTREMLKGVGAGLYFLQDRSGVIKIGKASQIDKRIASYRVHNSGFSILGIILNIPVSDLTMREKEVHARFTYCRIAVRREWFSPDSALLTYAKQFTPEYWGRTLGKASLSSRTDEVGVEKKNSSRDEAFTAAFIPFFTCLRCAHFWTARTVAPKACPKCHAVTWRREKRKPGPSPSEKKKPPTAQMPLFTDF